MKTKKQVARKTAGGLEDLSTKKSVGKASVASKTQKSPKKRGLAKRSGENATTLVVKTGGGKRKAKQVSPKIKSVKTQKSPQVDKMKKGGKIAGRGKKDINVVIEDFKDNKTTVAKTGPKSVSKSKERIKSLTKDTVLVKQSKVTGLKAKANIQTKVERDRSRDKKSQVSKVKKEQDESSEEIHKPLPTQQIKKIVIKQPIRPKVEVKEEVEDSSSSPSSEPLKKEQSSKSKKSVGKKTGIKHELGYNVNTKEISEEITKILKKIEERKKKKSGPTIKPIAKEKEKSKLVKKLSAQDYAYKLQINPNFKVKHVVSIDDLNQKTSITNTDVLLALIEIASNSDSYLISYSNLSRLFWEDVVSYKELRRIFAEFKGETLRKYWKIVSSIGDVTKTADLIKKHKVLFDSINIKLLPIILTIKKYLDGGIQDMDAYLKSQKVEFKTSNLFEEYYVDPITGEEKEIEVRVNVTRKRMKYEENITQQYQGGRNYLGNADDIIDYKKKHFDHGTFSQTFKQIVEENSKILLILAEKFHYLKAINDVDKNRILSLSKEEKFLIKVLDNVIDTLMKEFPMYNRNYLEGILKACSMNIELAYLTLRDPEKYKNSIFGPEEDLTILNLKNTQKFSDLVSSKGAEGVQEREDFLVA